MEHQKNWRKQMGGMGRCLQGFIAGFWFGPFGIVLGPFMGALVAGLISGSHLKAALKHASGALIGFFTGIVLKFINLGVIVYWFVKVLV